MQWVGALLAILGAIAKFFSQKRRTRLEEEVRRQLGAAVARELGPVVADELRRLTQRTTDHLARIDARLNAMDTRWENNMNAAREEFNNGLLDQQAVFEASIQRRMRPGHSD